MNLKCKYQGWRWEKHLSQPMTPLSGQKGDKKRFRMNKEQVKITNMLLKISLLESYSMIQCKRVCITYGMDTQTYVKNEIILGYVE